MRPNSMTTTEPNASRHSSSVLHIYQHVCEMCFRMFDSDFCKPQNTKLPQHVHIAQQSVSSRCKALHVGHKFIRELRMLPRQYSHTCMCACECAVSCTCGCMVAITFTTLAASVGGTFAWRSPRPHISHYIHA